MISEDALGNGKGGVGGRDPTVDGALEQDLFDLIHGQAVTQRGGNVHLQLFEPT